MRCTIVFHEDGADVKKYLKNAGIETVVDPQQLETVRFASAVSYAVYHQQVSAESLFPLFVA
eukprot:scaffold1954_cov268-Pinguiococcus_pyrenoidosus.AAC.27